MRHSPFFLPSRMEDGASRSPLPSRFLPDRKRKRFLAFARNDDAGRRHSPSFLWKEVPRRGGGWMGIAVFPKQILPQGGRLREGGFTAKKEANLASLHSAAPSKGRGSRGHSLLPMKGDAPKGRRLAHSGMKKMGRGLSPFRHPERSRGIFFVGGKTESV